MTSSVKVRDAAARTLAFRDFFPLTCLAVAAGEGWILFTVGRGAALVLLPFVCLATLVPLYLFGRYRLPDEEFDDPDFAGQILNLRRCFGTHLYVRDKHSRDFGKRGSVEISSRRSNRWIRGKKDALAIKMPGVFLLVTPKSYWLQSKGLVLTGDITTLGFDLYSIVQEVDRPRDDDDVIGSTWKHATKRGERDLRYRDNKQRWEV